MSNRALASPTSSDTAVDQMNRSSEAIPSGFGSAALKFDHRREYVVDRSRALN